MTKNVPTLATKLAGTTDVPTKSDVPGYQDN